MESWKNIQRDGVLKSWNKLKTENIVLEEHPIGMKLGDPKSFSDYIMLAAEHPEDDTLPATVPTHLLKQFYLFCYSVHFI